MHASSASAVIDRKRRATGDLRARQYNSLADPAECEETVGDRCRRFDRERKKRARQCNSPADPAESKETVGDRCRRFDRERKKHARQCNSPADLAESEETVGDRCRRFDRERKRCGRQRNPSSGRRRLNLDRRLEAVIVKPQKLCEFCNKFFLYNHESAGFCCGSGKLTSLDSQCFKIPDELLPVYENKYFGAWSRVVNNALRFSSPGTDVPGGMFFPGHPGQLRCCGQSYTRILNGDVGGPLRSWINDTSLQQQEMDKADIDHPSPHVLDAKEWTVTISKYLQRHNPFAEALMSMGQDASVEAVKFNFTHQSQHMEQERLSSQELALLYSTLHPNDPAELYAMVIPKHGSVLHSVSTKVYRQSTFYEPLGYPLLFLDGQIGWGHQLDNTSVFPKLGSKNGITLHEYTKYLLLHSPIISRAGRLRQAWVLEQYLRNLHNTLDYLRKNNMKLKKATRATVRGILHKSNVVMQRQIAIDSLPRNVACGLSNRKPLPQDIQECTNYRSLVIDGHDHHHEDTNETFTASELMYLPGYTYLPSSFPGGPRSQMLKFANAMTIAAKLGGPHFFTTFTTSPTWPELHEHGSVCPYIEDNMVDECRVFKEKLALFLEDLREGVFFEGRQLMYIVHAVEFQWRGHPHVHIVFRLKGDRLTPDEIDRMITTSCTQCKTEEEFNLLTTFMTHHCKPGLCLKEGKPCSEFFPKELSPSYQAGNRGYPTYRRLNEDDQFIVPCVLKMIAKFKCHINVRQYIIIIKH